MKTVLMLTLLLSYSTSIHGAGKTQKNWIALYIWDSFTPLIFDGTLQEMLSSLEVVFQTHANYLAKRALMIQKNPYGTRSTEGHYMFWLHLSDEFLAKHPIERATYGDSVFMFKDRQTDLFSAWGGQANFRDFILNGVSGLANPTVLEDGSLSGDIQSFETAHNQGNADFEGGFYLTDQQAQKALEAFLNYPGREQGYSFLRKIKGRAVNGYNCGDFAFHVINASGAMSKDLSEQLKVKFSYPKKYWDQTIPLIGSGKKIYQKFENHRDLYLSRDKILKLAWFELFFTTLRIFNQKAMVDEIITTHPQYESIRIWNQENVINYLSEPGHVDFRSKRVIEDLLPAIKNGTRIEDPLPVGADVWRFRDSRAYRTYTNIARKKMLKKLKQAGLACPEDLEKYKTLEKSLKKEPN